MFLCSVPCKCPHSVLSTAELSLTGSAAWSASPRNPPVSLSKPAAPGVQLHVQLSLCFRESCSGARACTTGPYNGPPPIPRLLLHMKMFIQFLFLAFRLKSSEEFLNQLTSFLFPLLHIHRDVRPQVGIHSKRLLNNSKMFLVINTVYYNSTQQFFFVLKTDKIMNRIL